MLSFWPEWESRGAKSVEKQLKSAFHRDQTLRDSTKIEAAELEPGHLVFWALFRSIRRCVLEEF